MKQIDDLLKILKQLRDPENGCPWDIKQNFNSIAKHTLEEAYEVVDAIDRNNVEDLKNELGDLLLQAVYHAQIATEREYFNFEDVVSSICDKLIRRHPHVFGGQNLTTAQDVKISWENIKAQERKQNTSETIGLLQDIPLNLPALMRAQKLQKRASQIGFDWSNYQYILEKVEEEWNEFLEAISQIEDKSRLEKEDESPLYEELGDILFTIVNLCRHFDIDAEEALRHANTKFMRRFSHIEKELESVGVTLSKAPLTKLEALWQDAKLNDKK